ncbi:MAG: transglycosylase SLT domain-containing protein [Proteobacteria bacterium]|nr:transglycosylase SLT domain-containing protein [Pseudomonadota bacterium]
MAATALVTALALPAVALDERLDPTEALALHEKAQSAAATTLARTVADPLPAHAGAIPVIEVPAEFADLMLAHEAALNPRATAALTTAMPRLPEPLAPNIAAFAPRPGEAPIAILASGELFDPAMVLRPAVPAATAGDLALVRQALGEYRRGNLSLGDAFADKVEDPSARLALEWVAIRTAKQATGFARLARFLAAEPQFPMADWVRKRAEEALYVEKSRIEAAAAFFADHAPETAPGMIALARARLAAGETAAAQALARDAWREGKTNAGLRSTILKEFPGAISAADQRYLAHRLIYDGAAREGLAVAAGLSPAERHLAQALAASVNETGSAAGFLGKVDPTIARDAALAFVRVQHLRRSKDVAGAARALLAAPTDAEAIVDGDEWWIERRMMVRRLLDAGDAASAYKVAAGHGAEASQYRVDAEVHAGWVALRFLNDAASALPHFERARTVAETPPSQARAAYWHGRALEAAGQAARDAYQAAAVHRHTYYGQLAMDRIGATAMPDLAAKADFARLEAQSASPVLRAIRVLLDSEAQDLAQPLIIETARNAGDLETTIVLGDLVARYGLPRLTVLAGKMAMQRGLKAEEHAFPTFGIPPYEPEDGSAEAAIVYSIARQESEFDAKAVSHAGARGLMQLMPATARRTASRFKIPLDVNRLTQDAALNARIGAAHLGELFGEYNGSYVLSFAAYNAGGRRVKEWTTAYGDPRNPGVDVVDWIERIPITETRHYVQKILENVQVYRVKLTNQQTLGIAADMQRGARKPRDPLLALNIPLPALPRHDSAVSALLRAP